MFSDAGYHCGLAGKLHLSSCSDGKVESRIEDGYHDFRWSHHPQPDWPENAYTQWLSSQGQTWDRLYAGPSSGYVKEGVPAEFHQTTWCAEMAIDFIRSNQARPWFFSFNCFDPHHPFDPPPEYLANYDPVDMPLPKYQEGELDTGAMTDDDRRQVTAAYYAMCELIDDQVGRVLRTLDETGQRDNTIVIFMSDHGEMLGDHGLYFKGPHFYDASVRVPFVISWPAGFQCDLRVAGLTELIDLVPTLLEACGLEIPSRVQGRSLVPHLTGRADPQRHRDHVYSEYYNSWTHQNAYATMLRTVNEKIAVYHGTDQGELYDLQADPDEFENLWDRTDYRALKADMVRRCFDASVFTMDPEPPRLGPF
jgi:arylsulfatase A-like enzyme